MKNKKLQRLTEKQERFCRHYLDTDGNASEAYRMAYDTTKMQPSTVHYSAWELMNNPKITQRIDELRAERREATEAQRKEVEARLIDIINADPSELYYTDPTTGQARIRQPWQLSKKMRHAVKAIRGKGESISYELHGKIEAARLLGSWNGWDAPQQLDIRQGNVMMGEIRIGFDDE
ncbi:MAG: terminase small subunit [Muribaculaceae bacterium]|nr:terminase small subunit [Muribaculaceae bacterium]